jgi:F-type H+-transporting ATPase subunit gamma
MAGNLIDLRRRINSVKNTQKITKAMKTVSAAKLRKHVTALNRNHDYFNKLLEVMFHVSGEINSADYPLLQHRDFGDILLVLITSDKGLCGSFNSHLIRKAEDYVRRSSAEQPVSMVIVGNKGYVYFKNRPYHIQKSYASFMGSVNFAKARELSEFLTDTYMKQPIKQVDFLFMEFLSSSKQEIAIKPFLPLSFADMEKPAAEAITEFIFEPNKKKVFEAILPLYVDSMVYQTLLESASSEHAVRMIAMELATRNAGDMIRDLTLTLNKMRQASITNELLEIITATEALKK